MPAKTPKRRRFKRCTVRILVDYWAESDSGTEYATTLGSGGLFLECEKPFDVGTELTVRFRLPDSDLLHTLTGRVAWLHRPDPEHPRTRAAGMAVEFVDPAGCSGLARALDNLPEGAAG